MNFITQISLIFYSVGFTWTVYWAIENYPIVGRWGDALEYLIRRVKKSKKLPKLKVSYYKNCCVVIVVWWLLIFILTPITLIYLYSFDQLIGDNFSIYALIFTPFLFLLVPMFVSRFLGFLVLLIAPNDYLWYKNLPSDVIKKSFFEPLATELDKNLKDGNEKWFLIKIFWGILGFNICCLIPWAIVHTEFFL